MFKYIALLATLAFAGTEALCPATPNQIGLTLQDFALDYHVIFYNKEAATLCDDCLFVDHTWLQSENRVRGNFSCLKNGEVVEDKYLGDGYLYPDINYEPDFMSGTKFQGYVLGFQTFGTETCFLGVIDCNPANRDDTKVFGYCTNQVLDNDQETWFTGLFTLYDIPSTSYARYTQNCILP